MVRTATALFILILILILPHLHSNHAYAQAMGQCYSVVGEHCIVYAKDVIVHHA